MNRQNSNIESKYNLLDPILNIREGQLNKILTAIGLNMSFSWFNQKFCDIDFTQEVDFSKNNSQNKVRQNYWANEIRCVSNNINVSSVDGFFDRLNFINFFKTISFIMKMNNTEYVEKSKKEKEQKMKCELENVEKMELKSKIIKTINTKQNLNKSQVLNIKNKLVFSVEKFNLKILEDRKILMMLNIKNLFSMNIVYIGNKVNKVINLETFGIQFLEDKKYKKVVLLKELSGEPKAKCKCKNEIKKIKIQKSKLNDVLDRLYNQIKKLEKRKYTSEKNDVKICSQLLESKAKQYNTLINFFKSKTKKKSDLEKINLRSNQNSDLKKKKNSSLSKDLKDTLFDMNNLFSNITSNGYTDLFKINKKKQKLSDDLGFMNKKDLSFYSIKKSRISNKVDLKFDLFKKEPGFKISSDANLKKKEINEIEKSISESKLRNTNSSLGKLSITHKKRIT